MTWTQDYTWKLRDGGLIIANQFGDMAVVESAGCATHLVASHNEVVKELEAEIAALRAKLAATVNGVESAKVARLDELHMIDGRRHLATNPKGEHMNHIANHIAQVAPTVWRVKPSVSFRVIDVPAGNGGIVDVDCYAELGTPAHALGSLVIGVCVYAQGDDVTAWPIPETAEQKGVHDDAMAWLARNWPAVWISVSAQVGPTATPGYDPTNSDSLDADWMDDGNIDCPTDAP